MSKTTDANKALVRQFYELMNARRFEEMWALFSEDGLWGGGGTPPPFQAPVSQMATIIVDPMPIFVTGGIDFTLHDMIAEDDRVAAEVESHAELTTGAVYNNHYHMLFRVRDGKITEVREYGDTLHSHQVFGDVVGELQASN